MDIHDFEITTSSQLESFFEIVMGATGKSAVNNDQFGIDLFDRFPGSLEEFDVILRFGRSTKCFGDIMFVPDFPVRETVFIMRDSLTNIFAPLIEMINDGNHICGGMFQNGQNIDLIFCCFVKKPISHGKIPGAVFFLENTPGKIGSDPSNSGLFHDFQIFRNLLMFKMDDT